MKRLVLFALAGVVFGSRLVAAPVPDFWYVVPNETPSTNGREQIRGIVVPSTATPTVETTPSGYVLSWLRSDGTTRSFAITGVSSFTFEPGPFLGTIYVPFGKAKRLELGSEGCCTCASWQNSQDSIETLSCVIGCQGCVCEACICSTGNPCPTGPGMTLVAENDPSVRTTFGKPGSPGDIAVFHQGRSTARVQGKHLDARLSTNGETLFTDPDSIELSGSVTLHSRVTADKAYFVWTAPDVSLILEQPRVMHEPSFHDGVIGLDSPSVDAATGMSKRFQVVPLMDRCSACGHYPNSQPDLDLMACVPGEGACLRCVSWEC